MKRLWRRGKQGLPMITESGNAYVVPDQVHAHLRHSLDLLSADLDATAAKNEKLERSLQATKAANDALQVKVLQLQAQMDPTRVSDQAACAVECCGLTLLGLLEDLLADRLPEKPAVEHMRCLLLHTQNLWDPIGFTAVHPNLPPDVKESLLVLLTRPHEAETPRDPAATSPGPGCASSVPAPSEAAGGEPGNTEAVSKVLETSRLWTWNVFLLQSQSNGRELTTLAMRVMRDSGLIDAFRLNTEKLVMFLHRVELGYLDNPYHNKTHAADVLQSMNKIMIDGGVYPKYADQVDLLCCYIASWIHDIDHTGFTNEFLIETTNAFALMHNNRSPHENHHLFMSWTLLNVEKYNFLENVSPAVKKRIRERTIELVLATDMKTHFGVVSQFTAHLLRAQEQPRVSSQDADRLLVLQMAMKLSDMGHLSAEWGVHYRWVKCLEEECFRQGDTERSLGLRVSPLMDRGGIGISASQVGFFEVVALPMVRAFVRLLDGCMPLRAGMEANYARWQQIEAGRGSPDEVWSFDRCEDVASRRRSEEVHRRCYQAGRAVDGGALA